MKKTSVRRSSRLQATEGGSSDEVSEEDPLFLQPRSSIKTHRQQPPKTPGSQPSPAKQTSKAGPKEEPKLPRTRGPRGIRRKTPESSDSEDSAADEGPAGSTPGSVPRVMLHRVKMPGEEQGKEEENEEAKHTPALAASRGIEEGTEEKVQGPHPARPEPGESRVVRLGPGEMRRRIPLNAPKVEVPDLGRRGPRDSRAIRSGITGQRTMTPIKPGKRSPARWICCFVLPCFLLLPLAGWYLWKFDCPVFLSGLSRQMPFSQLWAGQEEEPCSSDCSIVLVESIPVGLTYDSEAPGHLSIFQAWVDLIDGARSSLDIAAFYFTLQGADVEVTDPSTDQGEKVLEKLLGLSLQGVNLSIAVNSPQQSNTDTTLLMQKGADVKYVNLKSLTGGIVHTKLWVVDKSHIYIGSANMDWRSLTQVKELGAVLYNCSCLARDLHKVFRMYQYLGKDEASIPPSWPVDFSADSSLSHPQHVLLNGSNAHVYISSSPAALCAEGRTSDLDAILSVIEDAQEFVYIAVMDYVPRLQFSKPKRFWPVIDDHLRSAACDRGVKVQLLVSCWSHSDTSMFVFLESLSVLSQEPLGCPIQVKLFAVPATRQQKQIPYARVNHNKYMVTDRIAYIGTSNWSEDYFSNTAGVGLIINQTGPSSAQEQLEAIFLRDWSSNYTQSLGSRLHCASKV